MADGKVEIELRLSEASREALTELDGMLRDIRARLAAILLAFEKECERSAEESKDG